MLRLTAGVNYEANVVLTTPTERSLLTDTPNEQKLCIVRVPLVGPRPGEQSTVESRFNYILYFGPTYNNARKKKENI